MSSVRMSQHFFHIFMEEMKKINPNMLASLMKEQNTQPGNIDLCDCLISLDLENIPNVYYIHDSIGDYYFPGNLSFKGTRIRYLPDTIGNCIICGNFNLSGTLIKSLPDTIGECIIGGNFDLSRTRIKRLPVNFSETFFCSLILDGSSIETLDNLPDTITGSLHASNCRNLSNIDGLPYEIIGSLYLSGCNLRGLPDSVIDKTIQGSLVIHKLDYVPRYCFLRFIVFGGICIGDNCYEGLCWDRNWEYDSLYRDPNHNLKESIITQIPKDVILMMRFPSVNKHFRDINKSQK